MKEIPFGEIRALVLLVLKNYIAIFSTIKYKFITTLVEPNSTIKYKFITTLVEPKPNNLAPQLQCTAKSVYMHHSSCVKKKKKKKKRKEKSFTLLYIEYISGFQLSQLIKFLMVE